jgi:hypothetical protein
MPLLVITILLMVGKEYVTQLLGITLDNATITLSASFLALFLFKKNPRDIFTTLVDWEIIFFKYWHLLHGRFFV